MNNKILIGQKQRLDDLFSRIRSLSADPEMQSHWSRYLCVLVSGFIENALRTVLSEYAEARSQTRIANFVQGELRRNLNNPKAGKILDWIRKFDQEWGNEIDQCLDQRLKDAINSVVENRHQIAHGGTIGLSFVTMKEYYEAVVEAIELIEASCAN